MDIRTISGYSKIHICSILCLALRRWYMTFSIDFVLYSNELETKCFIFLQYHETFLWMQANENQWTLVNTEIAAIFYYSHSYFIWNTINSLSFGTKDTNFITFSLFHFSSIAFPVILLISFRESWERDRKTANKIGNYYLFRIFVKFITNSMHIHPKHHHNIGNRIWMRHAEENEYRKINNDLHFCSNVSEYKIFVFCC